MMIILRQDERKINYSKVHVNPELLGFDPKMMTHHFLIWSEKGQVIVGQPTILRFKSVFKAKKRFSLIAASIHFDSHSKVFSGVTNDLA